VSRELGGSCQIPLAAFATVDGGTMRLRAMVATPDGKRIATADASGPATAPEALGKQVVETLNAQDAASILAVCKTDG
jgi:hydroxymethylbilane synthase